MPADYEIVATDSNDVYPIGPNLPNKEYALETFNHQKIEGVGPFTFDKTAPPTGYYLRERSVGRPEVKFALYKASQPD